MSTATAAMTGILNRVADGILNFLERRRQFKAKKPAKKTDIIDELLVSHNAKEIIRRFCKHNPDVIVRQVLSERVFDLNKNKEIRAMNQYLDAYCIPFNDLNEVLDNRDFKVAMRLFSFQEYEFDNISVEAGKTCHSHRNNFIVVRLYSTRGEIVNLFGVCKNDILCENLSVVQKRIVP